MKRLVMVFLILLFFGLMIGCESDADIASYNLSKKAEMFGIIRRVVFYNGITGEYILSVEGRCSIEVDNYDKQLELTCKTGVDTYKKHYLGLSDNVTYFAEQIGDSDIDVYHYKVIFKPKSILPDIDFIN